MKAIWEKALLESTYSSADVFPQVQTQHAFNEGYEAFVERGKLYIKADSVSTLTTAFAQISISKNAGEEQAFLGSHQAKYAFRPLWVFGEETLYLNGYPVISLPKAAMEDPKAYAKEMAFALIEGGYQTLVLGDPWLNTGRDLKLDTAKSFLSSLKQYGISTYLFLNPCVQEKESFTNFQEKIKEHYRIIEQEFESIDGIITRFVSDLDFPQVFSYPKRTLMQINSYEELIGNKKLIFYFDFKDNYASRQCATWIEELLDGVGEQVSFGFSQFIGDMRGQSFKKNCVWQALNKCWDSSSTAIIPFINAGGVDTGEGLWPNSPLQLFHDIQSSMHRHPYKGILPFTRYFPLQRGYLRASLWAFGASLWQELMPKDLLELFFKAYHLGSKTTLTKSLLLESEEISHMLQKVQANPQKESGELALYLKYILAKVNLLSHRLQKLPQSHISSMMKLYIRDVKKKLLLWNEQWKLHISEIVEGDDLKESFWVDIAHSSRGGLGGSVKGELRDQPYAPEQNSEMINIINENR